jgi:hypothetical protein
MKVYTELRLSGATSIITDFGSLGGLGGGV